MNWRRALLAILICAVSALSSPAMIAGAAGMVPGQHSTKTKYWSQVGRFVRNYTPFEFDYGIENLTPGLHDDTWFSVGQSLEHIAANGEMSFIQMPYYLWRVSGIAVAANRVWFTLGQSGKVGAIDDSGRTRFIQVVPRRKFPDLQELVANNAAELWFVDAGRRSIGYRSASGRVVENPFAQDVAPVEMRHCMGRLWVTAIDNSSQNHFGVSLYLLDENLRPQPKLVPTQSAAQFEHIACDSMDRLWLSDRSSVQWFDRQDRSKKFSLRGLYATALTSDNRGGVWVVAQAENYSYALIHFTKEGLVITRRLPTLVGIGHTLVEDPRGRLWFASENGNCPVAVTELSPRSH